MRAACFFAASARRVAGDGEGSLPRRRGGSLESERPGRNEGPAPLEDGGDDAKPSTAAEEEETEERPKKREVELERRDSPPARGVPPSPPPPPSLFRGDALMRPAEPTGLEPRERGAGAARRPAKALMGLPSRATFSVDETLRAAGPAEIDEDDDDDGVDRLVLLPLLLLLRTLL